MSTQDDSGILFEISNEQQNFRLLELPPSLLALLVSKDPPNLWLKSAESPNADDSKQPSPSAVLCTNDHTYQLRQVQSSNSVFILQPSESRQADDTVPSQDLLAIAQCTSTLELISSDSAVSFALVSQLLKRSLLSYGGTDTDVELGRDNATSRASEDKDAILRDAPFSTKELNEAWKRVCAFEVLGRAWLPTPSALAMIWQSILSTATVRGVNLENRFEKQMLAEVVSSDGYPWALFMAVVTRLVSDSDNPKDDGAHLSKEKTIEWIGDVCLQKIRESDQAKGVLESDFLAQWQDLLPEGWKRHASMDLLKAKYSHSDPSKKRIIYSDHINGPTSLEILPSASSAGKANRKWHDKFKAGRKYSSLSAGIP